jgi:hypothetical protein
VVAAGVEAMEEGGAAAPAPAPGSTSGSTGGGAPPEPLYAESGEHGRVGGIVRTVGNAPVRKPVALSEQEARQHEFQRKGSGSAWNVGGTWEDKDMSKWAKSTLPGMLSGVANSTVSITGASIEGGRASVVMVRGQMRPGWDLNIKLQWEAVVKDEAAAAAAATQDGQGGEEEEGGDGEAVEPGTPARDQGSATFEVTDLDDDDDLNFDVKGSIQGSSGDAQRAVAALATPLHARLLEFKQAMVEACS